MRKTLLLLSVLLFLVACGPLAQAQAQTKIPRMGFLDNGPPRKTWPTLKAIRQRLQELGHIEGKTIHTEWRHGSRDAARLPALAAELIRRIKKSQTGNEVNFFTRGSLNLTFVLLLEA